MLSIPGNNLEAINDSSLSHVRATGNSCVCICSPGTGHMDADSGLPGRCALAAPDRGSGSGLHTIAGQTFYSVDLKNPASPESSHRPLMALQQSLADCCHLPPLSLPPLCGIYQTPFLSTVGVLPRCVSHAVQLGWLL